MRRVAAGLRRGCSLLLFVIFVQKVPKHSAHDKQDDDDEFSGAHPVPHRSKIVGRLRGRKSNKTRDILPTGATSNKITDLSLSLSGTMDSSSHALVSLKRPAPRCSAHMAHSFTECTSTGCKRENHAFRQFESLAENNPDFLRAAMNNALQVFNRAGKGLRCVLSTDNVDEAIDTVLREGREFLVCHDGCQCACHGCTRLCTDLEAARQMGAKGVPSDEDIINSIGSNVRASLLMPERQMVELASTRKYFVMSDVAEAMAENLRKGLWNSSYMQSVDLDDLRAKGLLVDAPALPGGATTAAQTAFFAYEHRGLIETHRLVVAVSAGGVSSKLIVAHDPTDGRAPLLVFDLARFARESKLKKKERLATLENPGYLFFLCYLHVRRNERLELSSLAECVLGRRNKKQSVKANKEISEYARRLSHYLDTGLQHANKDFMLKLRNASKVSRSESSGSRHVVSVGRSIGAAPVFERTLFKGIPDAEAAKREVEKMQRVVNVSRFAFSQMDSNAVLQVVAAVECAKQNERNVAVDERRAAAQLMMEESRTASSEEQLLLLKECAGLMCHPCE